VNTVMNIVVPYNTGSFVTSRGAGSFYKGVLFSLVLCVLKVRYDVVGTEEETHVPVLQ
jgi:hypothetical protein